MATTEAKSDAPMFLTDLPGIGAAKAQWLANAGVGSVEALRNAPVETIAHVRGIGYVLANRLKELVAAPGGAEPPPAPDAAPLARDAEEEETLWRGRLVDVQSGIRDEIGGLLSSPTKRALSPKFVKQLRRLRALVEAPPPDDRTVGPKNQRRIMKQTQAIRALLASAANMDRDSKEHQKVLRKRLRSRYKKLAKWV